MKSRNQKLCALFTAMLGVGMTGCFGESIVSAGSKVAGGQIASLTAGEIIILSQTVADLIRSQDPNANPPTLTTEQAQALTDFFTANNLNTIEDFETLAETAQNAPDSIQGLDALAAAFAGSATEIDPDDFDADSLDELLGMLFGG
jgi:hypothetical protein